MPPIDVVPVLVFDLDGTILPFNSFPRWVLFLIFGALPGLGWRPRGRLSLLAFRMLLLRKLGRLSHNELQRRLQAACRTACIGYDQPLTNRFEAALQRKVRRNLLWLLQAIPDEAFDAVLATAAAAEYAEPLGSRLGFRHVLATQPERDVDDPPNVGLAKHDGVMNLLHTLGWNDRPIVLFTDHIDDIPLIRQSNTVCWFGSPDMLVTVRSAAAATQFINCRDMDEACMRATFRMLCNQLRAALAMHEAAGALPAITRS